MTRARMRAPGLAVAPVLASASMLVWAMATPISSQDLADKVTFQAPTLGPLMLGEVQSASLLHAASANAISDPQELLAAARADYARILGTLYSQGRYSGTINILVDGREAASIPSYDEPRRIDSIVVRINAGPEFTFGRARVAPLAPGTDLPKEFVAGEVARSTLVEDATDAASLGWRRAGHAKVDIARQSIVADHAANRLDVDVAMSPGPRVTFGSLVVRGNRTVRTERIATIAGLPTGEVYDPDDLRKSARRLRRTGAFSAVTYDESDRLGFDNAMDVTATVLEAPPRRFGVGAEFDTSDGVTLSTFLLFRNLLGGAESLRFDAKVVGAGGDAVRLGDIDVGPDYMLGVTFSRPATFSPDTDLTTSLVAERKDERFYVTENIVGTFGLVHYFSDTLTGRAGLQYGSYRVTEEGVDGRVFEVASIPLGLTWDQRDVPLNPTSGYYLDATVQPFYGQASTGAGARATLDARAYVSPLASERIVLAARAQVGTVTGPDLIDTPRDYLFYSGGGGTVRGQRYQSLGVTNPNYPDKMIGGQSFLGLSGEVRGRITETIGAVAFYDSGYVGGDGFFGDNGNWQSGAGLGVRYLSPIGPIRFDVAVPVDGPTSRGVQIYIGIGQAF